jgi:hypothetical protein
MAGAGGGRPTKRLRRRGDLRWWAWQRAVAGVGHGGGHGSARWLGGEEGLCGQIWSK